jgi:hypothetical protein
MNPAGLPAGCRVRPLGSAIEPKAITLAGRDADQFGGKVAIVRRLHSNVAAATVGIHENQFHRLGAWRPHPPAAWLAMAEPGPAAHFRIWHEAAPVAGSYLEGGRL